MIDVATRFPVVSIWDAYERSQRTERWVFHETICSSLTLIYGRANVGKSWLVASMLLSLLVDGQEFLEMQPTDTTKLWKPAILWTDPGSDEEYAERICKHLPEGTEVPTIHVGCTTRAYEWDELTAMLLSSGHNFVVVDNLTGVAGDTNDAQALITVFDGLTRLTNKGVPVVVVHHESEKGKPVVGAAPLGLSTNLQKARAWIQVRQTNVRGLRGGNTGLVIRGNRLEQPQQVIAEPTSPNYKVIKREAWEDSNDKPELPKSTRSKASKSDTFDLDQWIRDNARGLSSYEAAGKLADLLGITASAARSRLRRSDEWVKVGQAA